MSNTKSRSAANAAEVGSRLRDSALWVAIGRSAGIVTTAALGIVLPRLMTQTDYANLRVIQTVLVCSVIVGSLGMNGALVRVLAENLALGRPHRAASGLSHGVKIVFVMSLLVAACVAAGLSFWGLAHAKISFSWTVVVGAALAIILLCWQQVAAETLRGLHEFRWSSVLSGGQFGGPISSGLFLVGVIGLAYFGLATFENALLAFVATFAVTSPIAIAALFYCARRVIPQARSDADLADARMDIPSLAALGVPLFLVALLAWITSQSDVLFCDWYCSKADVALYSVSRQLTVLIAMPLQMVNLTIISTIPDLKARGLTNELQRVVRYAALAAVPALVAGLALIVFARPIVTSVFGPDYAAAATLVVVMTIGQMVLVCAGSGAIVLAMTGFHNVALLISAISAATMLVLGPMVTYHYGVKGLATVSTAVVILECSLQWACSRKLVRVWTHFAPIALVCDGLAFWRNRREAKSASGSLATERSTS